MTARQRNEVIVRMAAQGIACNVHYKPLPMHSAYMQLGFSIDDFPNAYAQFVNEITLPLHTCLNNDQVDYIIENFTGILREVI
jgi:dTDP-4-amino-4,6-dideoxygalactose transaminase